MAARAARPPSKRTAYHHGDLRSALVAEAEALLAERGLEGFTLRECARRAGVSNAAPAHHFRDVSTLLSEVATLGFQRLAAAMRTARDAAGADPAERLVAVGRAYVEVAVANPATFHLMFHAHRSDPAQEGLRAAGSAAYALLEETLAPVLGDGDRLAGIHLAWSAVHGFATLLVEGRLGNDPRFGDPGAWRGRLDAMLALMRGGIDRT